MLRGPCNGPAKSRYWPLGGTLKAGTGGWDGNRLYHSRDGPGFERYLVTLVCAATLREKSCRLSVMGPRQIAAHCPMPHDGSSRRLAHLVRPRRKRLSIPPDAVTELSRTGAATLDCCRGERS